MNLLPRKRDNQECLTELQTRMKKDGILTHDERLGNGTACMDWETHKDFVERFWKYFHRQEY